MYVVVSTRSKPRQRHGRLALGDLDALATSVPSEGPPRAISCGVYRLNSRGQAEVTAVDERVGERTPHDSVLAVRIGEAVSRHADAIIVVLRSDVLRLVLSRNRSPRR